MSSKESGKIRTYIQCTIYNIQWFRNTPNGISIYRSNVNQSIRVLKAGMYFKAGITEKKYTQQIENSVPPFRSEINDRS